MALTVVEFPDLRTARVRHRRGRGGRGDLRTSAAVRPGWPADQLDSVGGARFGRDLLGANNTAAALLLPLAVALCRSVDSPRLAGRVLWGLSAAIVLTGIVLTGSRGGLLAVAACFLTAMVAVVRGRRILAGYLVAALVAVAVVLTLQPAGIGARTDSTDSSGRTDIWRIGIAACHTYCLTGAGWGTFPRVYEMTQPTVPEARTLVRGPRTSRTTSGSSSGSRPAGRTRPRGHWSGRSTLRDSLRLPNMLRAPP